MQLNLNDEQLQKVIAAAVLQTIDGERKDALLKGAIQYMLAPTSAGSYERSRSPLQRAFESAVDQVARQVVTEKLTSDAAFIAQVDALFAEAAKKAFADENRGPLADRIATAIRDAMSKDR